MRPPEEAAAAAGSMFADMILTCDDFVIPRVPESNTFQIERFKGGEFPLGDFARRVTSELELVKTELGPVSQEERMWCAFGALVKDTRHNTHSSRGDDEAVITAAKVSRKRGKWMNWVLATQAVVDAALLSMQQGGVEVPVVRPAFY